MWAEEKFVDIGALRDGGRGLLQLVKRDRRHSVFEVREPQLAAEKADAGDSGVELACELQ